MKWSEVPLLGLVSDRVLAEQLGVTRAAVTSARAIRGIPALGQSRMPLNRARALIAAVAKPAQEAVDLDAEIAAAAFRCDECGAERGERCRTPNNKARSAHHLRGRVAHCEWAACPTCAEAFT